MITINENVINEINNLIHQTMTGQLKWKAGTSLDNPEAKVYIADAKTLAGSFVVQQTLTILPDSTHLWTQGLGKDSTISDISSTQDDVEINLLKRLADAVEKSIANN